MSIGRWSEFSAWIVVQVVLLYSDDDMVVSTKRIQLARGWCATVNRDCANCSHLILPLRRPGLPVFLGGQSCDTAAWLAERQLLTGDIESNPKPTLKTLLHTLTQSHTLTKYTKSPVHPYSPHPTHRLTHPHLPNPICPLCKTHPHTIYIQLHTLIYLKQHTGPLDVSREGGASASQVERTPGRATITYWVV